MKLFSKAKDLFHRGKRINTRSYGEEKEDEDLLDDEKKENLLYVGNLSKKELFDLVRRGNLNSIKTVDPSVLLNAKDNNGNTGLMIATQMCHFESCQEILKKCPSLLYHQNNYKMSVLHQAANSRNYRLIDFFVSAGLKATKSEGGTENMMHFKKWINLQNSAGNTALILAAIKRSHDIVQRFVEVDRQYKLGLTEIVGADAYTALDWAMRYEHHEMIKMLTDKRHPNLDYGANTDDSNFPAKQQPQPSLPTGNSSGTGVVRESNVITSAELSKHNNLKDCWLLINDKVYDVTKFLGDHPGGSEVLLKASGKVATTDFKKAHSHSSNAMKMMDKFYVGLCDSIDLVRRGNLEYIKTVDPKVLLKARDKNGSTVLMIATRMCHFNSCKEILKKCPSLLYQQNNYKMSVLHHAARYRNYRLIDFFVSTGLEAAKSEGGRKNMLRFKKWINLQDSNGHTVLILAVIKHSHDIVKRFVEVDRQYMLGLTEIVGADQNTALKWAILDEQHEMIKMLTDDGSFPISNLMQQAQESLQNGNNSDTGGVSERNIYTYAEVSKHNSLNDCWLLINDKVYDVTKFLRDHPGGSEVLLKASGKDATTDFKKVHSHSGNAVTMMDKFYVGVCDSIATSLSKLAIDKPQPYSRVQLKEFTKDFSELLGSGGFGDIYKGQFPDGVLIAVKVLKNIEVQEKVMEKQFVAEVDTMGRAYHRNLIKLYGYCYEANTKFKALVYDYMENGSFDKILFEKKLDIPWAKLHNIAKEIAQGISYLHESCFPQIIHHDIKPANVLLDSNLSPKVIDFGLAKVNMEESQFEQTKIKGSRNYMAPEVNQPEQVKLSCKLDVYSFGKLLFDILGSKRNQVDKSRFPGQVWEKYKTKQLDTFILECGINEDDKENAKRLAIIALLCVEHNPRARPMLSNVVKMLEGNIKQLDTPVAPFYPDYYSSECSSMSDSRDY